MNTGDEVQYELLRPAQAVARRKACPLAYLPVGIIEYHGQQNPLGLDGLQVHEISLRAARCGGGVVFPVPWYGENRAVHLAEANLPGRAAVAAKMELPPENFGPGAMGGRSAETQSLFYRSCSSISTIRSGVLASRRSTSWSDKAHCTITWR